MKTTTIPMKWSTSDTGDSDKKCACCGRRLGKGRVYVEVIDGGSRVARPGTNPDPNDSGYMGLHPVGLTCAKRHFDGYTHDAIDTPLERLVP